MIAITSEKITTVVGDLYQAASGQSDWLGVVEQLRNLLGGSQACLAKYNPDPCLADAVSTVADAEFGRRFYQYGADNEILRALHMTPVGAVYSDHAAVGFQTMRQSALWNEWMQPQDMYGSLSCKLFSDGDTSWFFDVQRGASQTPFDAAETELLQRLAPHLVRAGQISRHLRVEQIVASALAHLPFGHLVVDGNRRIVSMNAAAEAIVAGAGGMLTAKAGILTAARAPDANRLDALIADACRITHDMPGIGGEMAIRAHDDDFGMVGLSISVAPLGGTRMFGTPFGQHAAISLREISLRLPAGFADHIRDVFGLTPAEAKLAATLTGGRALKEAAADSGLSFGTARRYLERIFRKTGARQQSQLVALLKAAQPFGPLDEANSTKKESF